MHATGTIQVGTTVLGLSQIAALLEQIEQDSDSARKVLTEQKASISKNQEAYVLITYLGLKIARVDYLEKFQESRRD
jgi:hypothetical protein